MLLKFRQNLLPEQPADEEGDGLRFSVRVDLFEWSNTAKVDYAFEGISCTNVTRPAEDPPQIRKGLVVKEQEESTIVDLSAGLAMDIEPERAFYIRNPTMGYFITKTNAWLDAQP